LVDCCCRHVTRIFAHIIVGWCSDKYRVAVRPQARQMLLHGKSCIQHSQQRHANNSSSMPTVQATRTTTTTTAAANNTQQSLHLVKCYSCIYSLHRHFVATRNTSDSISERSNNSPMPSSITSRHCPSTNERYSLILFTPSKHVETRLRLMHKTVVQSNNDPMDKHSSSVSWTGTDVCESLVNLLQECISRSRCDLHKIRSNYSRVVALYVRMILIHVGR